MGVAEERECKMCVCNREDGVVGVAEERKCKMCVCNREGGVVGVAEERKCKMCVRNRGDQGSLTHGIVLHTHTHYYTLSFCGHTKSTQKYNIDYLDPVLCRARSPELEINFWSQRRISLNEEEISKNVSISFLPK